ncbi:hypothetical protein F8S20_16590 [Nostoc sp. BAE]|nr:hypothetical protein [Nostoc commune BAE]
MQGEKTVIAPLGVASPQSVQGVSEKEKDLPTAIDCTTLTLVDAVQAQSASLLPENLSGGVESKDSHEEACSAASVAENEKSLNSAIANQAQGQGQKQLEQGNPTSLLVENSVLDGEMKAAHESEGSAAPVPNPEKWSHEAIVARSNMRPGRMQKLKVAGNSGHNPGFDFLQECWNDPALQIVIKKLLARFPQWGFVAVDGC